MIGAYGETLLRYGTETSDEGDGWIEFPSGRSLSAEADKASSHGIRLAWRRYVASGQGPMNRQYLGRFELSSSPGTPLRVRERYRSVSISNNGTKDERFEARSDDVCCTEIVRAMLEGRRLVLYREPDGPYEGWYSLPISFEEENGGDTIWCTSILRVKLGAGEAELSRTLHWDGST